MGHGTDVRDFILLKKSSKSHLDMLMEYFMFSMKVVASSSFAGEVSGSGLGKMT